MTIPRIIHQIWVGPDDPPMQWIEGWRGMDGWNHRLWTEKDLHHLSMRPQNRRVFAKYMAMKTWHGASDVARVEILCQHGGIFLDADMEMVAPFDDAPWLQASMCAAFIPNSNRLSNGIMGCTPGAPAILDYQSRIGRLRRRHVVPGRRMYPVAKRAGPSLLTEVSKDHDIATINSGAFFPEDKRGEQLSYEGTIYGHHHWMTTRRMAAQGADDPKAD